MRPPLFSREGDAVFVDTPWPRETVFSMELLELAEWVRVEYGLKGEPERVLLAVANGMASYEVLRFDDATGTVWVRLKKARRTPHRPPKPKRANPEGRFIGFHSFTGCYGVLRERELGAIYCEGCGWTTASEDTR